jgi:hypothetical protein
MSGSERQSREPGLCLPNFRFFREGAASKGLSSSFPLPAWMVHLSSAKS